MRARGLGRLRRIWRWATAPLRSEAEAVILLYHRVFEAPIDPQLLCVTPQNFSAHMEHLQRRYRVLSLGELRRGILEGTVPKRAVVVTFDDGYADNLWNARPVLERYGVPATVFVAAGYVGQELEFWWDEVERLLLHPGRVPRTLRMDLDGGVYEWDLGDAAEYTTAEFERHRGWHVLMKGDPTPRHRAYRELCRLIRPLPAGERRRVLDGLREWAGVDGKARWDYRPLSRPELLELTRDRLVEVGSHTLSHPVLSALSLEEQHREISESKATLEAVLGRPVVHFAYPYGSSADYTSETVALVREAGFEGACSNFAGTVGAGKKVDWYQLPRFLVRNWTGEEFARRLARWFRE